MQLVGVVDVTNFEPLPPIHESVGGATKEWLFLGAQTAIFFTAIAFSFVLARKSRSWIPVLCVVGGVLCLYTEPMIDAHLQVWWPKHHQPDAYRAWGRDIPLMLIPILGWYFGAGSYLRWYFLEKYGERFRVWWLYFAEVTWALLLEPPAIQMHLWHYYGFHGLRIFGYPVWWPFVGGACGVAAGTAIYKFAPYLKGPRVLLVPAMVPMAVVAVYWSVGQPMFNVLNNESPHALVYAMSFLSIGLAMFVVWLCTIVTGHHTWLQQRKKAKGGEAAEPAAEELVTVGA